MKKIRYAIFILGLGILLTGCGSKAQPAQSQLSSIHAKETEQTVKVEFTGDLYADVEKGLLYSNEEGRVTDQAGNVLDLYANISINEAGALSDESGILEGFSIGGGGKIIYVAPEPEAKPAAEEYIFPDSDKKYLTEADLQEIPADQLRIGRNEIFARHGAIFESEDLQAHFSACSWYSGTTPVADIDMDSVFNEFEKKNVALIRQFEDGGDSAAIPIVYGIYSHQGLSGECTADIEFGTGPGVNTISIDCMGYGGHGLFYFDGILEESVEGTYFSYCDDFNVGILVKFVDGGMDVTIKYDDSDVDMSDLEGHYTLDRVLKEVG